MLSAELSAQHSRVMLYPNEDSLEWAEAKRVISTFDPQSLLQSLSTVNKPSRVEVIKDNDSYLAWEDCNLNVYRWTDAQWAEWQDARWDWAPGKLRKK